MRRFPRWAALLSWSLAIPAIFAGIPLALSTLGRLNGWERGPGPWNLAGIAPLAVGAFLIVWVLSTHWRAAPKGWSFEKGTGPNTPPEYLLITGPYAWSRHPLFLGEALVVLGWAIFLGNVPVLAALAIFLAGVPIKAGMEERRLLIAFGDDYLAYRAAVPRWLGPRRAILNGPSTSPAKE